ncbi:MAG TPA: hypothetical protein VNG33_19090 [Polyangiaceae bacterium]|nr:hypothetical protein [Polyangiaceae bacterium]
MKVAFRVWRVSLVALLWPCLAPAQAAPPDARSESVALLREAEQLAAAGSRVEACQKYGESYSLDAELDALLPWAECLENAGKWASAHAAFLDAADVARRAGDARFKAAGERANRLRPRLSYLTVEVPQAQRLPSLSIERDGFRLGSSGWGVPLPIDPGSHSIVVRAYGYRDWQTTVEVLSDAAAPFVEVPLLEKLPVAAPAAPALAAAPPLAAAPATPPGVPAPAPAPAPRRTGLPPARVAALVAGGVAVVSAGVGLYFLGKTHGTLSERDGICPTSRDCEPGTNAHLARLTQQASNQQRAEITFFAIAGAAAALGTGLWLFPKPSGAKDHAALLVPVAAPAGGGLWLRGAF